MRMLTIAAVAAAVTMAVPGSARAQELAFDYVAETCFSCHRGGEASGIPSIVGRPGFQIARALAEYRDGTRKSAVMQAVANDLDPLTVGMLSTFLAKQR